MLKKIFFLIASGVFIFGLTACGTAVKTYTANPSVPVVVPAPPMAK